MNGVDWPAVKAELGPRAARAQTDGELRDVIRDMLGRLGLSHFAIIPSGRDNVAAAPVDLSGDPGFDVRLVGPELLVVRVETDGGAAAAGVRPGWRLLAIDGLPIAEMLSRLPESMPVRLRNVEIWRMVETRLRGPLGSQVPLMFNDGVSDRGLTVARRAESGQAATVGNLPTMHVRVESRRASDRTRRESGRDWLQRLDAGRRSPLPAGRRQVSRRERHRRRSARQPGRAGGDDHGNQRALPHRAQAARDHEDARQRAALSRQPATRQRRRRSASSRMPARSPSSSMP